MKREDIYDGIRGFAFLLVLLMHGFVICFDGAFRYLQGCPKYGVWLFFVLSSFLLTRNYILANGDRVGYVLGRIFRILPLYFVCCIIYTLLNIVSPTGWDWLLISIAQYGPIHLWTIPVEFYFYFILFGLWMISKEIVRDIVFIASAVISFVVLLVCTKKADSTNTFWYISSFAVGYFLARYWNYVPTIEYGFTLSTIVLCVFIFLSPGMLYLILDVNPTPYLTNMYLPLSILWALFIIAVCKSKPNIINNALSSKYMRVLGSISYSGYLFHWIIMVKMKEYMGSGIVAVFLSISLTMVVAYVLFRFVEMPIYRLRNHLRTP